MRIDCKKFAKGYRVLAGTKQDFLSEYTEGFERIEKGVTLLKPFESESLFSQPPSEPIIKIVLIRDNKLFRFLAWCEGDEKYRMYTRDFAKFAAAITEYTNGKLNATDKLWNCGYYITILGPEFRLPDTPSCNAFESRMLKFTENLFGAAIDAGIYGLCESELFQAKAQVESAIRKLEIARQRFTPSQTDFENQNQ